MDKTENAVIVEVGRRRISVCEWYVESNIYLGANVLNLVKTG